MEPYMPYGNPFSLIRGIPVPVPLYLISYLSLCLMVTLLSYLLFLYTCSCIPFPLSRFFLCLLPITVSLSLSYLFIGGNRAGRHLGYYSIGNRTYPHWHYPISILEISWVGRGWD